MKKRRENMTTKLKIYRHGDLLLRGIDKLPEGLAKTSKEKVLHRGSHGNEHSFDNGTFYPQKSGDNILGYFEAKDTTLLHPEHGMIKAGQKLREAKIQDGFYELRSQMEITHEGMREVVD
jgi:hypothetical protein